MRPGSGTVPRVLVGAHVSTAGGLRTALGRGASLGADVVQIFTQSPRAWRSPAHGEEELAAYRLEQARSDRVRATFCHATYLINLASSDEELLGRSRACLADNLAVATAIGASGLILHVGSHRGAGLATVCGQVADELLRALDTAARDVRVAGAAEAAGGDGPTCPLLLENAAGAGGTVGRTFGELSAIVERAGDDPRLGLCLDTQHLFASGVDYSSIEAADEVVRSIERTVGLGRLGCIHLNDSKVPLGANRDRHENLGEGEIGVEALACLLGHPALREVPAVLEVPGDGNGPRAADVAAARKVVALGLELRSAAAPSALAGPDRASRRGGGEELRRRGGRGAPT